MYSAKSFICKLINRLNKRRCMDVYSVKSFIFVRVKFYNIQDIAGRAAQLLRPGAQ
jgi:hypothetical protein